MAKRKQAPLPHEDFQRPHDDLITQAAENYKDVRDTRMDLTKKEREAQDKLLDLMDDRGWEEYVDEDAGLKVQVVNTKRRAKVKSLSSEDDSDDED